MTQWYLISVPQTPVKLSSLAPRPSMNFTHKNKAVDSNKTFLRQFKGGQFPKRALYLSSGHHCHYSMITMEVNGFLMCDYSSVICCVTHDSSYWRVCEGVKWEFRWPTFSSNAYMREKRTLCLLYTAAAATVCTAANRPDKGIFTDYWLWRSFKMQLAQTL